MIINTLRALYLPKIKQSIFYAIILVTDGIFPYVIGGMQKHSYYLCKYLTRLGVEIDLYHTNLSKFDISQLELFTSEEKSKINSIVIKFPDSDKMPGHYLRALTNTRLQFTMNLKKEKKLTLFIAKDFRMEISTRKKS